MKKIFKKNQIIITALAIMIIIAGYLNFSQRGATEEVNVGDGEVLDYDVDEKTASDNLDDSNLFDFLKQGDDVESLVDENSKSPDEYADISDEDQAHQISDNGEIITQVDENVQDEAKAETTSGLATDDSNESDHPGEAVLVSTKAAPDYFINARISREQLRAKNKETLMGILENASVSEADKSKATQEIINITSISEKENATESLLEAKGYSDAVVSIDENVSVVVNATSLNEQDMAQIEDLIKRETGADITEIVIYPVVITE